MWYSYPLNESVSLNITHLLSIATRALEDQNGLAQQGKPPGSVALTAPASHMVQICPERPGRGAPTPIGWDKGRYYYWLTE